ncbi:sulfatase-like hydrolase/transferase [Yoonia tamlensis]|uniref:sulfatase-like hydrolase/transferase n=1 Tax=Yoonia tamlensis TaxID=390270 RepID=UPI000B7E7B94|nr:sulfatase-like hydrolase/transferase [Yoonia tamlensis]
MWRKVVTAGAAIAIVCLASVLIMMPYLRPQPFGRAALGCGCIAIVLGGRGIWLRPGWHFLAVPFTGLLILPGLVITNHFGNFDLISVIHHLGYEGGGPDMRAFAFEIQDGVLAIACFALAIYWLRNLFQGAGFWYYLAALFIGVINPMSMSLLLAGFAPKADFDLSAQLVVPVTSRPASRPDIIMIYLEGLDRRFADTARYGAAYAGLLPLQSAGLDLTRVGQIAGTGWSLAGVVATQCGLPLLPNGMRAHNGFEDQTKFMASQICLGDVAAGYGYQSSYIVGASAGFAGQDHFVRSHRYQHIIDSDVLAESYDGSELAKAYEPRLHTYDDQLVFDAARRHYDSLVAGNDPLLMSVMTFGPHGTSGILSRHCRADGQARYSADLRQTVACSISDMLPFLDHIRTRRAGRPTLVVVMSDHLNHKRDLFAPAMHMNTVTFLGYGIAGFPAGQENTRAAAMIDVYPTVLALSGFAQPDVAAGLGRSVLGNGPTLVEQYGIAVLDRALETDLDLRLALWR